MKNITMIATATTPALVPFAAVVGDAVGSFVARDRFAVIDPTSAPFVDPRPAGPPL